MLNLQMKSVYRVTGLLMCLGVLVICGCTIPGTAANRRPVPTSLDLPADFKVQQTDWVDNERPNAGWFLHVQMLRGKAIKERNGVTPIHVMKADLRQYPGNPLLKDDLIIGVNGSGLGEHAVDQFAQAVRSTQREKGQLAVTRWRKGEIETVMLQLGADENIPDLTAGDEPGETRDWALGPIGANGWGYSQRPKDGASSKARQLLITLVDEEGPAAGKLAIGDVIVGAGGKHFSCDARRALADAINEAEREKNRGELILKVWRGGETSDITLSLPVLGTYSKTAPFDCAKTDQIIDNAVEYMKQNHEALMTPSSQGGWLKFINALGLLATGREDVMPIVREFANGCRLGPDEKLSVEKHVSMQCWWWSYKTVFMCEYYLRTGDRTVLPTIEEYATKIAMGQSGAGTWGHTYAARENTGYLHGHLGGYGAINQQGLTLMIALPLAVKCGIDNQEVLDAVKRGDDFFSYFIGKGTIPYGDHGAAPWFDDNGKSGSAAIFFDLMDNRDGTQFFSEMILASTPGGREAGHTGHFWSHLWGGVGAARGGNKGLQIFMDEMDHIFTLERQHDGRFVFQGNVGENGDQGKPKDKWDCTGARLLQLCVPRRILYVTGKETPEETHLTRKRVGQILEAGRLHIDKEARAELSKREILALLADPLSPTRAVGIRALEERELDYVSDLIRMLDSKNPYARYGAAEALGRVGFASKEAADKLIQMMATDSDTQFRVYAVNALTSSDKRLGLLTVAKPAIPVLLKMAVEPAADDPRKVLQHDIARSLFYNGRAQRRKGLLPMYGLEGVDRDLLIPAIKEILTNKNGWARSTLTGFVYPLLTAEELDQLWGDVYRATRHIAPSGIMFASGARTHGLKLMAQHRVKEGMELAAWYIRWQKGHGGPGRVPAALEALESYGTHAQAMIPYLEEHVEYWKSRRNPRREPGPDDTANRIIAAIERIKAAEETPELVSISDFLTPDDIPPRDGP